MKKVFSVVLIFTMLLSFAGTALAADPVAEKLDSTSIVNVTGKVDNGKYVTLLLLDSSDSVKHVQEAKPETDGTYRIKFKFAENTDGLKLQVKQGAEDVTDSVISAVTESEVYSYAFGATTLDNTTSAIAEFTNYFNVTGKKYVLMVAFYDNDGKLISVNTTGQKEAAFDETKTKLELDIPENAEKIKAFMWNTTQNMIPLATAKTTKPVKTTINVLALGNSFTDDPTAYLKSLMAQDGFELNILKRYIGGGTILQHWNKRDTEYNTGKGNTLRKDLDPAQNGGVYYDYVTIQQVSNDSGILKSYGFEEYDPEGEYENCAVNLVKLIRQYQPTAEIVLQLTWAYEKGSTHWGFANYNNDQETMHNAIVNTVETACELLANETTDDGKPISLDGKPLRYIPTGFAFYNARQNPIFDTTYVKGVSGTDPKVYTLCRDGYHSSHLYGRYLGALVWYGALTGNSPLVTQYNHVYTDENSVQYTIDEDTERILKDAAQDALESYGRWN